jgi:hypothetical protein
MKIVLFITFLFIPFLVKADEPRYRRVFTSSNGKYELRNNGNLLDNQKWSLIEKETGRNLYDVTAQLAALTILVGDDGKNLVAVDDYSESEPESDPEVLQFFLNGRKQKSYKLSALLENTKIVQKSVSHFRWIVKPLTLSIADTKFRLKTYELFDYEFDINTGEMLKKERDSRLTDGAIYAYGDISGSMSGAHKIKIYCLVYGKMPPNKTIDFESKKYIYDLDSMFDTVIIKDGKLVENLGIRLNMCTK